jgi:hypothetical protein
MKVTEKKQVDYLKIINEGHNSKFRQISSSRRSSSINRTSQEPRSLQITFSPTSSKRKETGTVGFYEIQNADQHREN